MWLEKRVLYSDQIPGADTFNFIPIYSIQVFLSRLFSIVWDFNLSSY